MIDKLSLLSFNLILNWFIRSMQFNKKNNEII